MPSKRRKKHHPAVNLSLVTPKQRQKTPDVEPNPTPTTIKIDTTKNQIKTFHKNSKLAVPVHQPTLQTLRTAPLKSILKKPVQLPPTTPPPSTTPEAPVTTPCNRKKKRKPKKKKKKPAKIINSSRFSFYQTDTALCVDIYEPNVSALDVIFLPNHFHVSSASFSFSMKTTFPIIVSESTHIIHPKKIELRLVTSNKHQPIHQIGEFTEDLTVFQQQNAIERPDSKLDGQDNEEFNIAENKSEQETSAIERRDSKLDVQDKDEEFINNLIERIQDKEDEKLIIAENSLIERILPEQETSSQNISSTCDTPDSLEKIMEQVASLEATATLDGFMKTKEQIQDTVDENFEPPPQENIETPSSIVKHEKANTLTERDPPQENFETPSSIVKHEAEPYKANTLTERDPPQENFETPSSIVKHEAEPYKANTLAERELSKYNTLVDSLRLSPASLTALYNTINVDTSAFFQQEEADSDDDEELETNDSDILGKGFVIVSRPISPAETVLYHSLIDNSACHIAAGISLSNSPIRNGVPSLIDDELCSNSSLDTIVSATQITRNTSPASIDTPFPIQTAFSIDKLLANQKLEKSQSYPGLVNLGSGFQFMRFGLTCYVNSIIQCIASIPKLVEYFITDKFMDHLTTTNRMSRGKGRIAQKFSLLLKSLKIGVGSVTPVDFIKCFLENSDFDPRMQHDSQEFLNWLLDTLHEDLNLNFNNPMLDLDDFKGESSEKFGLLHSNRNKSVIYDEFLGTYQSTITCSACGTNSKSYEPFLTLSVEIPVFLEFELQLVLSGGNQYRVSYYIDGKATFRDLIDTVRDRYFLLPIFANDKDFISPDINERLEAKNYPDLLREGFLTLYQYDPNSKLIFTTNCLPNGQIFGGHQLFSLDPGIYTLGVFRQRILNLVVDKFFVWEKVEAMELLEDQDIFEIMVDDEWIGDSDFEFNISDQTDISNILIKWENIPDRLQDKLTQDLTDQPYTEVIDLADCLSLHLKKEEDEIEFKCEKCNDLKAGEKKLDLFKLPNILVIHLKRFIEDSPGRFGKKNDEIKFPIEDFDFSHLTGREEDDYELFAVSNHANTHNSLNSGHYFTFSKRDGGWYRFDDEEVCAMGEDEIQSPSAYLLFYQKKT